MKGVEVFQTAYHAENFAVIKRDEGFVAKVRKGNIVYWYEKQ